MVVVVVENVGEGVGGGEEGQTEIDREKNSNRKAAGQAIEDETLTARRCHNRLTRYQLFI